MRARQRSSRPGQLFGLCRRKGRDDPRYSTVSERSSDHGAVGLSRPHSRFYGHAQHTRGLPLAIMFASTRRRHRVNESGRLKDKTALVTGASSGLGKKTGFKLVWAGTDVALVARSAEELESAKEEVLKTGRRALTLPTDLAKEEETSATIERTVEEFGRVDVLVNAAGTDAPGTVEELPEAGGGTIVNVSSVAGKKGWANASAYCASKFGLTGFTQALADEGKEHNIRA